MKAHSSVSLFHFQIPRLAAIPVMLLILVGGSFYLLRSEYARRSSFQSRARRERQKGSLPGSRCYSI